MSKYRAKKITIDGIVFDSKVEAEFYLYLKDKKEKGKIKDFGLQQKFVLQESFKKYNKTKREIAYKVDFVIIHNNGEEECIDIKGYSPEVGNIKRKMFDFKYPNKKLTWISKNLKYGNKDGWIEYDELNKKRREAKKAKKAV